MEDSHPSSQKVAVITGAASGIGSWLATYMHDLGYLIVVCDCNKTGGQAVATSLDASGKTAIFIHCDVKDYASQQELFKEVWAKWTRLDVLIANAGCVDRGSLYNFGRRNAGVNDLPPEPDMSCTDIDFKGVVYGTTLATHFMRLNSHGKGGKIIVTGSMIGIYPCQTFPEYCAAKAAAHQWVKTMGPILQRKENITINCVMPGGIETPAMPGFSLAFLPKQMTRKSNLISGYEVFLRDTANKMSGITLEASHDTLIEWGHPGYKSGEFAKRTEAVFEPWFELLHGERSGLPSAIQDWPDKDLIDIP